jgi:hypothetical protein
MSGLSRVFKNRGQYLFHVYNFILLMIGASGACYAGARSSGAESYFDF